jgi:Arc/MetJ family transcription regulator
MATNLQIDEKLLNDAQRIGGHRTKRETVNSALAEYVQRREQMKIFDLAGTIEYRAGHDYKKQRRRNVGTRRKRGAR